MAKTAANRRHNLIFLGRPARWRANAVLELKGSLVDDESLIAVLQTSKTTSEDEVNRRKKK